MPKSGRLLSLLPLATVAAAPAGAPLKFTLTGITEPAGQVKLLVCKEAEWLKPTCSYEKTAPASGSTVTLTVPGVAPGIYGVTAYHDKNSNGKADRNMIGLPTERVGFSNDAPVRMAPPKFADAKITHGTTPQSITFALRKLP